MKDFLSTFGICFIFCMVMAFLFAGVLASNIWAVIFIAALALAILITVFLNLSNKIEDLEKKLEQLQTEKEPSAGQKVN